MIELLNTKNLKENSGPLKNWLQINRSACHLKARPISLKDCKEWTLDNGILRHSTGRFFSVTGYRVKSNKKHLSNIEQPIIDQPEIGILGFLVKKEKNEWQWLFQAKAEPGNVNEVQGAPTVQATKSNYEMVHNGLPTHFLFCFLNPESHNTMLETNVEQSEQGDRFLNKYNRNCVGVMTHRSNKPTDTVYRWFSAKVVRGCLLEDYTINTDARSVILCSNWERLTDHGLAPFSKWSQQDHFGRHLFNSLNTDHGILELSDVLLRIDEERRRVELETSRTPLTILRDWILRDDLISKEASADSPFQVQFYNVQVRNREVNNWCQPLFSSTRKTDISIICSLIAGTLHFYLRLAAEPGFNNKIQLAPSVIDDPSHQKVDWCISSLIHSQTVQHASVLQSDEGGRFMHSIAKYSIYEVDQGFTDGRDVHGVWLTLHQIKKLTEMRGYLTNEARSALSILLAWS